MTVTAFFTVQCKFVTTMDSLRKEAEENTQRTNSRGYYYFDEKPDSAQTNSLHVDQNNNCEANDQKITPRKSRAIASFDPTNKIAKNFFPG